VSINLGQEYVIQFLSTKRALVWFQVEGIFYAHQGKKPVLVTNGIIDHFANNKGRAKVKGGAKDVK
jgi:hypothetical protein